MSNGTDCTFFRETEFAIGLSSGIVELWHIEKGNNSRDVGVKTRSYQAHEARIKGMSICGGILFTGDSSGCVKGHTKEGKCIFELQTNARITCLTVTDVNNGNGDGQDGTDQMEIENLGEIKNQMSKEKVFFVSTNGARDTKISRFFLLSGVVLETSLYKIMRPSLSHDPENFNFDHRKILNHSI